jgi:hypothetical protein
MTNTFPGAARLHGRRIVLTGAASGVGNHALKRIVDPAEIA